MLGQAAHERDRVLVGAHRGLPLHRQCDIDVGQRTAFPAHRQVRRRLVALDLEDHLLDQRAKKLLPVARCCGGRIPDIGEIGAERDDAAALLLRENAWALMLATSKLRLRRLERGEAFLPCALEATCDEPIVGIDGAIAALGETWPRTALARRRAATA